MRFAVFTDTSANLPTPLAREKDITVLPFSYIIEGVACRCLDTEAFDGGQFYGAIRQGTKVDTSLIPPGIFDEGFRPVLRQGRDILFVSMSSGVSGSYASSLAAAEQLRREFPERRILCLDTLGASLGEGLLALRAAELRDRGVGLQETFEALEDMKAGMCQVFTVDDLMHLRRTGRLSNAKALIATVLDIKPLLKGDQDGRIVSFEKARGRRRSIEAIAAAYDRLVENAKDQIIGVAHADCPEDAQTLIALLKRRHPPKDVMLVDYEPVTGSHVGPGALALFFMGSRAFRSGKVL
jgi:DegV family protein with EDD domain